MRTKNYKIWPLRLKIVLGVDNAKDVVDQNEQPLTHSATTAYVRVPVKMRHGTG